MDPLGLFQLLLESKAVIRAALRPKPPPGSTTMAAEELPEELEVTGIIGASLAVFWLAARTLHSLLGFCVFFDNIGVTN